VRRHSVRKNERTAFPPTSADRAEGRLAYGSVLMPACCAVSKLIPWSSRAELMLAHRMKGDYIFRREDFARLFYVSCARFMRCPHGFRGVLLISPVLQIGPDRISARRGAGWLIALMRCIAGACCFFILCLLIAENSRPLYMRALKVSLSKYVCE
jgi:hypothetical protein